MIHFSEGEPPEPLGLAENADQKFEVSPVWQAVSLASAAASAYHGYRRNDSAGWAIGWFVFGGVLPFLAIPIALAQGFAQPRRRR